MYQELQKGWIEVITGPMFAGKSEELIRRITTLSYAHKKIVAFKPVIDTRYDRSKIATHAGKMYEAFAISKVEEILDHIREDTEVVAIDEAQFFAPTLVDICDRLADRGLRVIVAGLDMDFTGRPFGPMGALMCKAEIVSTTSPARSVTVTPEIVPTPALRSTRLNVTSPEASRCGVFAVTETCRSSAVAVAPTPSTSTRTALDRFS